MMLICGEWREFHLVALLSEETDYGLDFQLEIFDRDRCPPPQALYCICRLTREEVLAAWFPQAQSR